MRLAFTDWFESESRQSADEILLEHAFMIAVCRIEAAASRNASDPIACFGSRTSKVSRLATKSMLSRLGYTPAQTRIVQRLLAGSGRAWPGLLRLYVDDATLTTQDRAYVARQFRAFRAAAVHANVA
jgi:hypothetical protein